MSDATVPVSLLQRRQAHRSPSSRCRAISMYSRLTSMPMLFRPALYAAMQLVPLPTKGSRTIWPSVVNSRIRCSHNRTGFGVKCPPPLLVLFNRHHSHRNLPGKRLASVYETGAVFHPVIEEGAVTRLLGAQDRLKLRSELRGLPSAQRCDNCRFLPLRQVGIASNEMVKRKRLELGARAKLPSVLISYLETAIFGRDRHAVIETRRGENEHEAARLQDAEGFRENRRQELL